MVHLDFPQREMAIKLVYYGPARSGKTTNLKNLHGRIAGAARGRLMALDTTDDRTLFFDLLPIHFRTGSGLSIRVKLYTVPGQVLHNSTRKMVLTGADGVAFVADSQVSETRANNESYANLKQNLREIGLELGALPVVVQWNKRDLPGPAIRGEDEIAEFAARGPEPVYRATALDGVGVIPTFLGLLGLTWDRLDKKFELASKFGVPRADFFNALLRSLGLEPSEMDAAEVPLRVLAAGSGRAADRGELPEP